MTLQTSGQNHTATIDLNQFLPVGDEATPIPDLSLAIINNAEGNEDKITHALTGDREETEVNVEQIPLVKVEPDEVPVIRKSKRLSQPRQTKKVKQKVKITHKAVKVEIVESDLIQPKEEIPDDNNDVYDSDGTVDLNETEDEKCIEPNECDLFLDHEKFAGFPKVIIENSKLVFRGKKLLDLLSR